MTTQGTSPQAAAAQRAGEAAWREAAVVPLRAGQAPDEAAKPEVDKRSPARGILFGVVVSACLWAVVAYVVLAALR
jgi:ferric-dicitrate binding protein FerR (iron transport regulator)